MEASDTITATCQHCGDRFPAKIHNRWGMPKYCKQACRCSAYHARNKEKIAEKNRAKYYADPDASKEKVRAWRAANPEKKRAAAKRWNDANKDKVAQYVKNWRLNNPEKAKDLTGQRKWIRVIATPPWVKKNDIRRIGAAAKRLEYETGVPHDVDHIVPLQNPHVCGLHVPWNLRPIRASDNRSKSNRLQNCDLVTYFDECLEG